MIWNSVDSKDDLLRIIDNSNTCPQVIFKHSTSCSISAMAKMRIEDNWDSLEYAVQFNYLDLLANRNLSNYISQELEIHHESPQLILIINGEAIYDASHFDISINELTESLEYHFERAKS